MVSNCEQNRAPLFMEFLWTIQQSISQDRWVLLDCFKYEASTDWGNDGCALLKKFFLLLK